MNAPAEPTSGPRRTLIARERGAFDAHRSVLRGGALPTPEDSPRGTLLHGFLLPFSLILATLRDPELRAPYLRVVAVRLGVLCVMTLVAFSGPGPKKESHRESGVKIAVAEGSSQPVKVDLPGFHVDVGRPEGDEVRVLGQKIPVIHADHEVAPARELPPQILRTPLLERGWHALEAGWAWLLALVAFLSGAEGVIVFFSRRYDDWIGFEVSRLVAIAPEDETPKERKLTFELRWLYRKAVQRVRGWLVFAAGVPALAILRLVPSIGTALFSVGLAIWSCYWFGVFAASKSAHAWADGEAAPSPAPIRFVNERISPRWWGRPFRLYARPWARVTRNINPAAKTFEQYPLPFLGLALARVVLSFPGIYFLSRPILPIAAGRLCAEADPAGRFWRPAPLVDEVLASEEQVAA